MSDPFFYFYYFDFEEGAGPVFATSPISPLARERHPQFVELFDRVEELCAQDPHRETALPSAETAATPVGAPVDDATLRALRSQAAAWTAPEQLNLFSAEELGEFYVGPESPKTVEAVLGALLVDLNDPREGSLACAEFNRAVGEGWNPVDLRNRVVEVARLVAYAARCSGVAMIEYFRSYALVEAQSA